VAEVMQKILYAALFTIALPSLLVLWAAASRSQVDLPLYGSPRLAWGFITFGFALMAVAMRELWVFGGGLPMNAFPPPSLVTRGAFRYFAHPIYIGFVALCLGISMLAGSRSGLWLITPTVTLSCVALVLGYEHPDLLRRFGRTLPVLPADDESRPTQSERFRFLLQVVIPWVALYEFTIRLPLPGTRFGFAFEDRLPIISWTTLIYESTYVAVVLAPWCARTRAGLRRLTISAWFAMLLVFPFYWLVPSGAPRRPLLAEDWISNLLHLERATYPPVAALPSFHVVWAILVSRLYRPRWLGWIYVTTVAVSCITTGMHYIADVLLAFLLALLFLEPHRVWDTLLRATEHAANSWHEWRIGPVRIINHSFYAGLAAFTHLTIVLAAVGPAHRSQAVLIGFAGLIGAAIWAQWIEGSTRLRRPFGFYGGLIAVGLACSCFSDRWLLLAANCLAAPWLQAIGRLRCLVNGCCHGVRSPAALGIRVIHPRSRITRLADLAGVPIHPTQLYSILGNVALGLLLLRLWISGCPMTLICGIYGMGNGLTRFVEEAYRGEPQTLMLLGLRLYQWLAVVTVLIGAGLTTIAALRPPVLQFSTSDFVLGFVFSVVAAAALGVDFPESNRPFARLT
jgi:protein-S-isoprenylcysteine O-methyltransferase Ste14